MSSGQPCPTPTNKNNRNFSSSCYDSHVQEAFVLRSGYNNSKLYEDAPDNVLNILTSENVTAHFHHFCVTEAVSDITLVTNTKAYSSRA
jgi:hypothetical protein